MTRTFQTIVLAGTENRTTQVRAFLAVRQNSIRMARWHGRMNKADVLCKPQ